MSAAAASADEHMEAVVHAYVAAFAAGDPDRVAALFAPDGRCEDPAGTPAHVGREAIRAFYTASMQTGAKLVLEGPVRIADGCAVFPFSVHLHWDGSDKRIDVIDIFRFNESGEIAEMRAFFGPQNIHDISREV